MIKQKNKFDRPSPRWLNLDCMKAHEKANDLLKTVMI